MVGAEGRSKGSRSSLVVGLGATGTRVLARLRALLVEKLGTASLPGIRLLSIDSDWTTDQNYTVGEAKLLPDEIVRIGADLHQPVLAGRLREEQASWFLDASQRTLNLSLQDLKSGAGQYRQFGRMAIFRDLQQPFYGRLLQHLRSSLQDILSVGGSQTASVLFVASASGGTMSGLLMDVAYLIRHIGERDLSANLRLEAYLLLPHGFSSLEDLGDKARTYAFLKELDRLLRVAPMQYVMQDVTAQGRIVSEQSRRYPILDAVHRIDVPQTRQRAALIEDEELYCDSAARAIGSALFELTEQQLEDPFLRTLYEKQQLSRIAKVRLDLIDVERELLAYLSKHPEKLYDLEPRKFEELVARIWRDAGYEVRVTPKTHDGGKDIYALMHSTVGDLLYVIECKRYDRERPVGIEIVRGLYGVTQAEKATMGVLVTTSHFSRDALEFQRAVQYQLSLRDYAVLRDWLKAYDT